uniref:CASP-like protein n=1 Tax=Aegilops tauschii subsp. strangulata TaxID=200361 RepID=A0A453F5Y4_AEGTS
MEKTSSSSMASPVRSPPPEPAAEAQPPPPSSPPSQLPATDPFRLSPDNPTPAPPLPAAPTVTAPPPDGAGDSSPPSPPSPPKAPTHPPLSTTDPSPPLPRRNQTSAPRRTPPPPPARAPAPAAPPPPVPASPEAKPEQEADEAPGESENMALALALTQNEAVMPPTPQKDAVMAESPTGSPQKESALTVAKLLSAEDPVATEGKPAADKVAPAVVTESVAGGGGGGGGGKVGVGSKRWLLRGVPDRVRLTELKRAELGFRVSAAVFCLISLSVMSAGTTPGWAGDSFRRYNEYRYTLAASVMAFTYSGFQLVAEVHYLVTGRRIIGGPWGNYFNLAMDQVLAYLLLSASSAALSRNDVWVSRFGVDQFAKLINASGSMAFLAFIALGLSSVISAHRVFSSIP